MSTYNYREDAQSGREITIYLNHEEIVAVKEAKDIEDVLAGLYYVFMDERISGAIQTALSDIWPEIKQQDKVNNHKGCTITLYQDRGFVPMPINIA
ncbi:hypothetical protein [Neolewinella persica]|uniref:hypothetical protein n=1 Tax=Neolewinella persica TaxID=70998 RepID=UPI000371EE8A|nr:hypothetical protein [Neolewinella persica]